LTVRINSTRNNHGLHDQNAELPDAPVELGFWRARGQAGRNVAKLGLASRRKNHCLADPLTTDVPRKAALGDSGVIIAGPSSASLSTGLGSPVSRLLNMQMHALDQARVRGNQVAGRKPHNVART
jgi:hypothetical protein